MEGSATGCWLLFQEELCPQFRQHPQRFVPPPVFPKPAVRDGQQNARGWNCWGECLGCFWSFFTPQVCSVGHKATPLGHVWVLELLA